VRTDALEAALQHTDDHLRDRIECGKPEVHNALDSLRTDIDPSSSSKAISSPKPNPKAGMSI
jgi:hypothetical protein